MDANMVDVNDPALDEETEIELITPDDATHEFELGEAPVGRCLCVSIFCWRSWMCVTHPDMGWESAIAVCEALGVYH